MSTEQDCLTTDLFYAALTRYIDENKPDPIARRQLEAWKLEWKNEDTASSFDNDDEDDIIPSTNPAEQQQHIIRGTLQIEGEYVIVKLKMECTWNSNSSTSSSPNDGILTYSCRVASAKFRETTTGNTSNDNKDAKTDRKIRSKMIARLKQDSYISKLLDLGSSGTRTDKFDPRLAKAKIHVHEADHILEERADVSETAAEAIRRSVWSSAESSLDVVEVMLAFPSLPGTSHKSDITTITTTPLANRAKLRLLEDAMLDECEKEGEGELIEDLKISSSSSNPATAAGDIDESAVTGDLKKDRKGGKGGRGKVGRKKAKFQS
mmetsp:Transcript_14771/g.26503  ORF Transcript_14771/g.26503 Transcript_14771/m.26503 type:complete len:321 (-) Transcript_14771:2366-3328(-)